MINMALGIASLVASFWYGYQGQIDLMIAWLGVSIAYRAHVRISDLKTRIETDDPT